MRLSVPIECSCAYCITALRAVVLDSQQPLEQVFPPFVRLDEARNTESASVGLGLAIARTLVHQHGGDITLHNRPTGGLCASILLPR